MAVKVTANAGRCQSTRSTTGEANMAAANEIRTSRKVDTAADETRSTIRKTNGGAAIAGTAAIDVTDEVVARRPLPMATAITAAGVIDDTVVIDIADEIARRPRPVATVTTADVVGGTAVIDIADEVPRRPRRTSTAISTAATDGIADAVIESTEPSMKVRTDGAGEIDAKVARPILKALA